MDGGNTAGMVYVDFAKAFNSVNRRFLLTKRESFWRCKTVVRWIRPYLTTRHYRVQVADALSKETRVKIGVPQGPVFGPFLLFNVTTLRFADDVKMVSLRSKSSFLQSSLYNVWNRSINWDLPNNQLHASISLLGGLIRFNYPLPLEVRTIPGRSQTLF